MKKYFALLLAGAMAFSAAGCGAGMEDITEASTELDIYMWQDYISEDVIKAFEEEHDCTVNLTPMNSTAEAVEKLKAGCGDTFDLVMVQNSDVGYLADNDYVEKIKTDQLANTSTLKDYCWVSKSYGIPYLMQYIYVVYDAKNCPVEIKDYSDLLAPELQGKVASVDGARNLFSMALTALGYDPNTTEEAELAAAYPGTSEICGFPGSACRYSGRNCGRSPRTYRHSWPASAPDSAAVLSETWIPDRSPHPGPEYTYSACRCRSGPS